MKRDEFRQGCPAMLCGMGFCLSHISALEYWRSLDAFGAARLLGTGATSRTVVPSPAEDGIVSSIGIEDEILSAAGPLSHPAHVLIASESSRRASPDVSFHARTAPLPRGHLYRIARNAYVVSPELAFVQHAQGASFAELLKIGAEITGSYRTFLSDDRFDSSASGFASGLPLTDAAKMSAFISKAACERGVKNARRVARYLVEGCASPMEAVLAALLHVPRSRGGYGLPKPLANYRIDMRRGDSKAAGGSYYVCDLYWPDARLCVEYDSDMFHTGSERIASDSSRRNALAFRGISVVSVTRRQIMSREEMDRVAHLLAKKLGVRFSSPLYDFGERQRALRAELLSFGSGIVGRNVWRA